MTDKIDKPLRKFYRWLKGHTFGIVRILRIAIDRFGQSNATQAAAGMAFYAFFSIFPLLLFFVVGLSYVLESKSAYKYIIENVFLVLPTAKELIDANLRQVLNSRGEVGLIGLASFLWSSSSFFSVLAKNINQASLDFHPRKFFEDRVVALIMISLLALLLGLSLLSNIITSLIPPLNILFWRGNPLQETIIWRYVIRLVPFIVTLLLLIGLYRFIPKKKIGWTGVLIAAPVAALSWQLTTSLFTWLLQMGLVNYELVYGSLGTVVTLMFWIYLFCTITIFGAHLSTVIEFIKLGEH
ncbi:MAG: YihY/virulence factor BrkB family protein [Pelolinea sp.]|nr:YihY/virulence factor BrkB family protein [Pelolinea sp.]